MLQLAIELAQSDDRDGQFFGKSLDAVGDIRNLRLPVLSAARSRMEELEVVNHGFIEFRASAV